MIAIEQGAEIRADLARIANYLLHLSQDGFPKLEQLHQPAIPLQATSEPYAKRDDTKTLAQLAKLAYQERSRRAEFLDDQLFGEPAWDIMLDLFAARVGGWRVSVNSACIASKVPATTALRWVVMMERRGLIVRTDDPFDKRRHWLELSDKCFRNLSEYLRSTELSRLRFG